jgi:pimeloyl-ACP methyl ester carboxylesterase
MDVILIAGMWLDGSAWDDVVPGLEARGHRALPLTLPGQGDGSTSATFDDQAEAVVTAVDAAAGRPLVVGHSAASTLAWVAADARPEKVSGVALVGGFPGADGEPYFSHLEPKDGVLAFPGWEPFEGPDIADLDEETRAAIAARTVDVPDAVVTGLVHLGDERRYDVPVVMVCPEFSPDEAREWLASGDLPELERAAQLEYVDLDSGHWPMFSRPAELADVLADLADKLS